MAIKNYFIFKFLFILLSFFGFGYLIWLSIDEKFKRNNKLIAANLGGSNLQETPRQTVSIVSTQGGINNVVHTPIVIQYQPITIENAQSSQDIIVANGVFVLNHYNIKITTDLSDFALVNISIKVVADNKLQIAIENQTGDTLNLPNLSISILKLN